MHMGVGLAGRSAVRDSLPGGGAAPRSPAAASERAAAALLPTAEDPCSARRLPAGMPPEVTESACIQLLTRLRHFWDGMCNVLHKVGELLTRRPHSTVVLKFWDVFLAFAGLSSGGWASCAFRRRATSSPSRCWPAARGRGRRYSASSATNKWRSENMRRPGRRQTRRR